MKPCTRWDRKVTTYCLLTCVAIASCCPHENSDRDATDVTEAAWRCYAVSQILCSQFVACGAEVTEDACLSIAVLDNCLPPPEEMATVDLAECEDQVMHSDCRALSDKRAIEFAPACVGKT